MPQSDTWHRGLKRVALKMSGVVGQPSSEEAERGIKNHGSNRWLGFQVNPEDYKITFPQRTTVSKTRSSTVVEDFGQGVGTLTFSGSTGYQRDGNGLNGKQRMDLLESFLILYANSTYDTASSEMAQRRELYFYNFTDDKSYRVHLAPEGYSIRRSKDNPLLFFYEVNLYILGSAGKPQPNEINNAVIDENVFTKEEDEMFVPGTDTLVNDRFNVPNSYREEILAQIRDLENKINSGNKLGQTTVTHR